MLDRSAFFFDSRRARCIMRRIDGGASLLALGSLAASVAGGVVAATAARGGKPPQLKPTPLMPDPSDPASQIARQREADRLAADAGRQSTVLANPTAPTSLLNTGATTYTNQRLGQ